MARKDMSKTSVQSANLMPNSLKVDGKSNQEILSDAINKVWGSSARKAKNKNKALDKLVSKLTKKANSNIADTGE